MNLHVQEDLLKVISLVAGELEVGLGKQMINFTSLKSDGNIVRRVSVSLVVISLVILVGHKVPVFNRLGNSLPKVI